MAFEEWAFLDKWCGTMSSLLTATGSSATVWRWGPDYSPALQFTIVPPRHSESTATERAEQLQTLREGLALFAAVAWINVNALIYLLKAKGVCQVQAETRSHAFMMAELPVFVEMEVTRKLSNDPSKDFSWVKDDLVSLCCQLDEQNTSEAFHEAWTKVEVFSRTDAKRLRGLAIPVRVIVGKPEYSKASNTASGRVWDVVRNTLRPDQVQWGWFSSLVGSSSTLARRFRCAYYASFVVTCINAKNAVTFNGASAAFMKLATEMGPEAHLSALNCCLVPHRNSQRVCRMISGLFGGNICPSGVAIEPRAVDYACVDFQAESGLEMNALCSALAVTRSCRSFTFNLCSYDSPSMVKVWQWMAYALFSNRARSRSSVQQVTIYNAHLDFRVLQTVSRVLTATNTELELFAVAMGLETTTNTAARDAREYHLRGNAVIQVTEPATGRVSSWKMTDIFQPSEVGGVVLVNPSDDGSSEWVDVLVPGIGLCKVQRTSLVVCDHGKNSDLQPNLELEIHFRYSLDPGHLTRFLRLVGKHLRSLWIHFPLYNRHVKVAEILETCPHLQELTLRDDVVSTQAFVAACQQHNPQLRRLECHFDDVRVLAATLSNGSSTLARNLRWWHCNLEPMLSYGTYAGALQGLTRILNGNKVLQCLTVVVDPSQVGIFEDGLRRFNGLEVEGEGELSVACKLAFVSVLHGDGELAPMKKRATDQPERLRLHAPDVPVATKIFEFAKQAVRKVKVIAS